jgi:PPK2 family polyphosphate:nucleotide phosphotransferase
MDVDRGCCVDGDAATNRRKIVKKKELVRRAGKLARVYRVTRGGTFKLKDVNPADTLDFDAEDKPRAKELLEQGIDVLAEMQEMLFAQDRWSVLLVLQAMDAAGKDGTIKHVMSGVNPQGCQVTPFKQPSAEELDHDFLWRCQKRAPERGRIGIFNRSYYEEVLAVKVHPGFLDAQKLPDACRGKDIWKHRYEDIRNYEQHLVRNGTAVRKVFLHVSRDEQKRRFLDRLDQPD